MTAHDLAMAETRAAEARRRLDGTVEQLQAELEPRRLARVALAEVTDNGERIVRAGADTVRRNPGALAGATALLVAVLARKRIVRLFRASPDPKPVPMKKALPAERSGS